MSDALNETVVLASADLQRERNLPQVSFIALFADDEQRVLAYLWSDRCQCVAVSSERTERPQKIKMTNPLNQIGLAVHR